VLKINRMFPNLTFERPIDAKIGPDGALYVLEWGDDVSPWTGNNTEAQLVRVEFLGNPTVASADFDEDGDVDGRDFLSWQRGFGMSGAANRSDGDANVDGAVDSADLIIWQAMYGIGPEGLVIPVQENSTSIDNHESELTDPHVSGDNDTSLTNLFSANFSFVTDPSSQFQKPTRYWEEATNAPGEFSKVKICGCGSQTTSGLSILDLALEEVSFEPWARELEWDFWWVESLQVEWTSVHATL
jgi:hypothetical protein